MFVIKDVLITLISVLGGYKFSDYIIGKKAKKLHFLGYKISKKHHVHHSMYGLVPFFIAPFTLANITLTITIVGFGIGIIIEHTVHEGFVFINKVEKELSNID